MNHDQNIYLSEIFKFETESEALTEFPASELTCGGAGTLMETFFGAHDSNHLA